MREEMEEKAKKRKKKKGFGYYLYAFMVLFLTLANIVLTIFLLTYVQSMEVEGTKYSDKEDIIEWIKEDPLTVNSLYTLLKFKSGSYELPAYLEEVTVTLKAPWKVKVDVSEKQIMGGILSDGMYVYIDSEGLVLEIMSEKMEGIPVIEGISAKGAKIFNVLEVENEKVFSYIAKVSAEVEKQGINPDRIVWEDDSMNLYMGDILVLLGKSNFDEKLVQVSALLDDLEGRKGTLHLEHYNEMSTNISFVPEVEEEPVVDIPVTDVPAEPETGTTSTE